jgi:hypothetical protein
MNLRVKEIIHSGSDVAVTLTGVLSERWTIISITDKNGSSNTYNVSYKARAGTNTYHVFTSAASTGAAEVPQFPLGLPPVAYGDVVTITGSVAADYIVVYAAVTV